ncbi:TetR/AcrR family transcriptional regulator [Shewanella sp. SR44-3]|uniref:TetR/AcrR family transcriptional regulator n=1 Tax=Shewanella sp. SR44-3 TaxID=2760936 RepID=UPI002175A41A|nr:TetR/AcrR family transcriptional regulator [Shewanella sp. SR44-3]
MHLFERVQNMAKTISYDRAAVVDKATKLYWEKGFHATSMRELQNVIDMRPGSIYACFGSKEGLFKEALQHYAQMSLDQIALCKQASSSLAAMKTFISTVVTHSHQHAPSGMCMLAKTLAELTDDNAELLSLTKDLLKQVEAAFAEVLVAAQQKQELDDTQEPLRLARHVQIQLMGLRTYSRANDGNIPVDELVNDIFVSGPFQR